MADLIVGKVTFDKGVFTMLTDGQPLEQKLSRKRKIITKKGNKLTNKKFGKADFGKFRDDLVKAQAERRAKARWYGK